MRRMPQAGVIQDVVYNHFGPVGNYLPKFGPYLAEHDGVWGSVINLDGPGSTEVRRYISDNVRYWFVDMHVDALRLDAVHALVDDSPTHLLEELAMVTADLTAHLRRPLTLIAESDQNDSRIITSRQAGGYGWTLSGVMTSTTLCIRRSPARATGTTPISPS